MLENIVLQPRLKGLFEILEADESRKKEIIKAFSKDVLGDHVPSLIQENLDTLIERGLLLDYSVAYNRLFHVDTHLTYQRKRLELGEGEVKRRYKNLNLKWLKNDVMEKGNFYKVLVDNLESINKVIHHYLSGEPSWSEIVLLQDQLGVKPDRLGKAAKELEKKIVGYMRDKELFKEDILNAFSELRYLKDKDQGVIHFLLKLSLGEEIIYRQLKKKARSLLDRQKYNLLFQRSEGGFLYFFKLFYGQEDKAVIKFGIDPTDPDLHLGHAVPLNVLREFQDIGYKVTIILGDRTARIGDPTGWSKERPMLSEEQILINVEKYVEQAIKVLDVNKTNFVYNSRWQDKLSSQCLDEIYSKFNIVELITRREFKERIESRKPPSFQQVHYPVFQAIDSLFLGSTVEMGGKDQLINMLLGRNLEEKYKMEYQLVLFTPLLVGIGGKGKMSKSSKNYIAIKDSPEEMYRKIMTFSDYSVYTYYQLLVDQNKCFEDIQKTGRKDLFAAFGGLNLLVEYANNIVKENEIVLIGTNKSLLERLQEGNVNSLSDDSKKATIIEYKDGKFRFVPQDEEKISKSKNYELLEEFIYAVEREISRYGRKQNPHYKPNYRIVIDHEKRKPVRIEGIDNATQKNIKELCKYRKKEDEGIYDPRNLKERLARYLVEKFHDEEGLEAIDRLKEEMAEIEKKPVRYINLEEYLNPEGKVKVPTLFKRGLEIGIEAAAKKAEDNLLTINGEPVKFEKITPERGKPYHKPQVKLEPGTTYEFVIGSEKNPRERVLILDWGEPKP